MASVMTCNFPGCTQIRTRVHGPTGDYCVAHAKIPFSPVPRPLPSWADLGESGTGVTAQDITLRTELPDGVLDDGMSWSQLIHIVHSNMESVARSNSSPLSGMSFAVATCHVLATRPYQLTRRELKNYTKSGCFETTHFPAVYPFDEILLIKQSHAPCSACCLSFAGWADYRASPIVVGYDWDQHNKAKAGTFVFTPGSLYYKLPYKPEYLIPETVEEKSEEKEDGGPATGTDSGSKKTKSAKPKKK